MQAARAEAAKADAAAVEETTAPGHVPDMEQPVVAAIADPSVPPAAGGPAPALPDQEQELASLRGQLAEALKKADLQLGVATQKLLEAEDLRRRSMPPPPTEANEARVRAARLSAELAEVRIERDEQKRLAEDRGAEGASLREQVATLVAALEVREARAALSEVQSGQAQRKLEEASALVQADEASLAEVRRELSEARGQADELTRRLTGLQGELDVGSRELGGLRAELARAQGEHAAELARAQGEHAAVLRSLEDRLAAQEQASALLREQAAHAQAELLATQRQAQEREQQLVQEVRDREARMVAEVQSREAQLVAAAQSREAQLVAEAKAALEAATHTQLQKAEASPRWCSAATGSPPSPPTRRASG